MVDLEIQSLACSLGSRSISPGVPYEISKDDCLPSLLSMIRFLRCDDEFQSVRMQLVSLGVVQSDLIPILELVSSIHNKSGDEIFEAGLRLAVALTMPTKTLFGNKVPKLKSKRKVFDELEVFLTQCLLDFAQSKTFWKLITDRVLYLAALPESACFKDDKLSAERIIFLIRNCLLIDDHGSGDSDDISAMNQLVYTFDGTGILNVIWYLTSQTELPIAFEDMSMMTFAEIVESILRPHNPEVIAKFVVKPDDERVLQERVKIKSKDLTTFTSPSTKLGSSGFRRNRFAGRTAPSFTVQNCPALDKENNLVVHKTLHKVEELEFSDRPLRKKSSKTWQTRDLHEADKNEEEDCSTPRAIRSVVKRFVCRLLENGTADRLIAECCILSKRADLPARQVMTDSLTTLNLINFFIAFNRAIAASDIASWNPALVSQCLSVDTFLYAHTLLMAFLQDIETMREDREYWNFLLSSTISALAELAHSIWSLLSAARDLDTEVNFHQLGETLARNILYMPESRQVVPQLLQLFKPQQHHHRFMVKTAKLNHYMFKIVAKMHAAGGGLLVASKKRGQGKRSKKKKTSKKRAVAPWEEIDPLLAELLSDEVWGNLAQQDEPPRPPSRVTFDLATSTLSDLLSELSRLFFPSDDYQVESSAEAIASDVAATLKVACTFFADAPEISMCDSVEGRIATLKEVHSSAASMTDVPEVEEDGELDRLLAEEYGIEENEGAGMIENTLSMEEYTLLLCSPGSIMMYSLLLADWKINSLSTNHHIATFLHSVAKTAPPGLLCQLRLMVILHDLVHDSSRDKQFREIKKLAAYLTRKVTNFLHEFPKTALMEVPFLKTIKTAEMMKYGFDDIPQESVPKASKKAKKSGKKLQVPHSELPMVDLDQERERIQQLMRDMEDGDVGETADSNRLDADDADLLESLMQNVDNPRRVPPSNKRKRKSGDGFSESRKPAKRAARVLNDSDAESVDQPVSNLDSDSDADSFVGQSRTRKSRDNAGIYSDSGSSEGYIPKAKTNKENTTKKSRKKNRSHEGDDEVSNVAQQPTKSGQTSCAFISEEFVDLDISDSEDSENEEGQRLKLLQKAEEQAKKLLETNAADGESDVSSVLSDIGLLDDLNEQSGGKSSGGKAVKMSKNAQKMAKNPAKKKRAEKAKKKLARKNGVASDENTASAEKLSKKRQAKKKKISLPSSETDSDDDQPLKVHGTNEKTKLEAKTKSVMFDDSDSDDQTPLSALNAQSGKVESPIASDSNACEDALEMAPTP